MNKLEKILFELTDEDIRSSVNELMQLDKSGILPSGTIRTLAKKIEQEVGIDFNHALTIAQESTLRKAAFKWAEISRVHIESKGYVAPEKTVYVHVVYSVKKKQLDPSDRGTVGIYEVLLKSDTPEEGLANAALDGFHDSFGIKELDDFLISVRKTSDPKSNEIEQSLDYENGDLAGHVIDVERIDQSEQSQQPLERNRGG